MSTKPERVWVAGGRNYKDARRLCQVLDRYREKHDVGIIITGAQTGTDTLAEQYAREHEIAYIGVPAQWSKYGKRAGPLRNERIAAFFAPAVLIAFPGGPGTASAIKIAREYEIQVYEID